MDASRENAPTIIEEHAPLVLQQDTATDVEIEDADCTSHVYIEPIDHAAIKEMNIDISSDHLATKKIAVPTELLPDNRVQSGVIPQARSGAFHPCF